MRLPPGLLTELDAWVRDNLITADQRRAILARYDTADDSARQASTALTWLALIVAAIGAVVLVAWNWTAIPNAIKFAVSGATTVALYAAAVVASRARRDLLAERLALAGALFAGGVLLVTDDVRHVDPQHSGTLVLWSAMLAATAVLTPSMLATAVGTAIAAWAALMATGLPALLWWFLPIWPALAVAGERVPNRRVAAALTLAFGAWVFFVLLAVWTERVTLAAIGAVLAGNWIYSLTLLPPTKRPAFARPTAALVLTLLGLAFLLPSASHRDTTEWRAAGAQMWPAIALLAALAAGTLRGGVRPTRHVGLTILAVAWLIGAFTLSPAVRGGAAWQWAWTAIFSGAVIHLGAAAVRDAARDRDVGLLAVGLASIVIFVIVRVVDARDLVVSSAMLIASAVMLWWLGRVWRQPGRTGATA